MRIRRIVKRLALLGVVGVLLALVGSIAAEGSIRSLWTPDADMILMNAQVVTVDDQVIDLVKAKQYSVKKGAANFPILNRGCVAIKDGKIIAVTDGRSINKYKGKNTVVKNLKGKVLIPGLIDTHIHALGLGMAMTYGVDLSLCLTKEEVVQAVAVEIAEHGWGEGDWVPGPALGGVQVPRDVDNSGTSTRSPPAVSWSSWGASSWEGRSTPPSSTRWASTTRIRPRGPAGGWRIHRSGPWRTRSSGHPSTSTCWASTGTFLPGSSSVAMLPAS